MEHLDCGVSDGVNKSFLKHERLFTLQDINHRYITLENIHHHNLELFFQILQMNKDYEEFHCNHIYAGVVYLIHLVVVFSVLLEVLGVRI